jgi:hypothetical protein
MIDNFLQFIEELVLEDMYSGPMGSHWGGEKKSAAPETSGIAAAPETSGIDIYCICKRPHNGREMIYCNGCADWSYRANTGSILTA